MNARAPDRPSLQSTPTMRPRPSALCEKRSIAGASRMHGPHQLAQKTTSVARPCAEASMLESVTAGPARCSRGSSGALRPVAVEWLDDSPKTTNATIAASASASAISRGALVIPAPDSASGEQRDVVGDVCRLEARRVDRRALARRRDPVDQPRVVDELRLLRIAFRSDAPCLPHAREFMCVADEVLHPPRHLVMCEEARDGLRRVAFRVDRDRDDLRFRGDLRA